MLHHKHKCAMRHAPCNEIHCSTARPDNSRKYPSRKYPVYLFENTASQENSYSRE